MRSLADKKCDRILMQYGKELTYYAIDPNPDVLLSQVKSIIETSDQQWVMIHIPGFLWEMAEKFSYAEISGSTKETTHIFMSRENC